MLITTNMGIQVDPIAIGNVNVNFMRYVRPVSVQRTRRCLFGRSDPDQNKQIYENAANNERNRCIERYGFDPVKSEFVDKNEMVNIDKNDKNVQNCLDNNKPSCVEPSDEIVRDRENSDGKKSDDVVRDRENSDEMKKDDDAIKHTVTIITHKRKNENKRTVDDYFPKKKKPST